MEGKTCLCFKGGKGGARQKMGWAGRRGYGGDEERSGERSRMRWKVYFGVESRCV